MTPKEFHALCAAHDWYYSYSDDHSVWRRGSERAGELARAMTKRPDLRAIYEGFIAHVNDPSVARPETPVDEEKTV